MKDEDLRRLLAQMAKLIFSQVAGSVAGSPFPALARILLSGEPSFNLVVRNGQNFFQCSLKIRVFVGLIAATLPG